MDLLNLLFPRRCISCRKIGRYFCKKCTVKIEFTTYQICPVCEKPAIAGITHPRCQTRYSLDGLTSVFRYNGVIRKAVKGIKYRFVSDLAQEFISLIPDRSLSLFSKTYNLVPRTLVLIPIPLHSSRLHFRGFNQAEVLGKLLAKRLNIPVRADILKRVRKTVPQVEVKDREKRLKNMENVFSVSPNPPAGGSQYPNILLFDDVFTTGATLRAAANVLKRAGARKVWGIVLAHG